MKQTLVSVIMPVYNGQEYLNIAIDSILQQTYTHFEFIIIDDGSTDNSASIIKAYDDTRIRYIHQANQGLSATLNCGIRLATGDYIARMDCDDISYPDRLKEQVAFLEENEQVVLVGSSFDLINQDGCIIDRSFHLDRSDDIKLEFLMRSPFGHGTVMLRRRAFELCGVYDTMEPIEDYELWWRIAQKFTVANLPKQLYAWRINPEGISHSHSKKQQKPITTLMNKIWRAQSVTFNKGMLTQSYAHYSALGPKYQEQYLYLLASLFLALRRRKRFTKATRLYAVVMSLPGGKQAIKDMQQNPRSHNYNLTNIM